MKSNAFVLMFFIVLSHLAAGQTEPGEDPHIQFGVICMGHLPGKPKDKPCFLNDYNQGFLRINKQSQNPDDYEPHIALTNWPSNGDKNSAHIWNMLTGNDKTSFPSDGCFALNLGNWSGLNGYSALFINKSNFIGINKINNQNEPPARLSVWGDDESGDALGSSIFLSNRSSGANDWYFTAGAQGTAAGSNNLVFYGYNRSLSQKKEILTLHYGDKGNRRVGVNTASPEATLDVNGNCIMRLGNSVEVGMHSWTGGDAWIGTLSKSGLSLGAFDIPSIYIDTADHVFIGREQKVSPDNLEKYNLFVTQGVLSNNYAIAPVSSWADDVFDKSYKLRTLNELETYIDQNNHLPDIPTQAEVSKNGYEMHELNTQLLRKIEELTLYTIQQQKKIDELSKRMEILVTKQEQDKKN